MNDDEAEIRRIIAQQAAAWTRGDAEGYGAACDDDVGFTNIVGMRWETRAGFNQRHAEMFRSVFAGSRLSIVVERLRFHGSTVAVAELLTELSDFRGLPPGIPADADGRLRTRMLEVFAKSDGSWKIVACHNTAVRERSAERGL
ncbi:MAG: SgcJ/EcaC family oxidoreductase [Gemmatimonadales bacterium]